MQNYMTKFTTLNLDKRDRVAVLTLDRPSVSNALNQQLMLDMDDALTVIEQDDEIRVLIITGKGKHFSAGADITEVQTYSTFSEHEVFFRQLYEIYAKIENFSKPTIAAINGLALGGGLELTLRCDIRVASDKASFGLPEIKLGTIPGAGGTQRITSIIGVARALEMIYTGGRMSAEEAFRVGLVNRLTPPDSLMAETEAIANNIANKSPIALRIAKTLIKDGVNMDTKTALKFEIYGALLLSSTYDFKEGLNAFLEKREPNFLGK